LGQLKTPLQIKDLVGIFSVFVDAPAHSGLTQALDYTSAHALKPGMLVRVPLGNRLVWGVVWEAQDHADIPADQLKPVQEVFEALPALNDHWRQLVRFAASYYQRSLGEMALQALPPQLRTLTQEQLNRRLSKIKPVAATDAIPSNLVPVSTPEQMMVLQSLQQTEAQHRTALLFGSTGSGKTEVYLRRVMDVLEQDPKAQALIMVPEINLTPQLEDRIRSRFESRLGVGSVVSMHSAMTPAQRLGAWLAAHLGHARIALGTRLSVFASLPHLKLIVVDEEHDPSYKQQEGARYSARDLAVYRGHCENIQVILGSATPSLESWHQSRPAQGADPGGRYLRLSMPSRVGQATMPDIQCIDMRMMPKGTLFAPKLLHAMRERVDLGEQVMVLLNRRGWAPVLMCSDCDWKSQCPHCSAYRVFHREDRTLRCHHCALTHKVPRMCPSCGNLDLGWQGRGTEQLQDHLENWFAQQPHPSGRPYAVMRMDADSTRLKGSLEDQLSAVHAGQIDVLVGTQMIAKGHDFKRMGMVVVADPDGALFSGDFRAPERLFDLLLQAAGRAGRAVNPETASAAQVWIQTRQPDHPLFASLTRHDYPGFAAAQLKEREAAGMPPYTHQALLRAEAPHLSDALAYLEEVRAQGLSLVNDLVTLYPPVPMAMQRLAQLERAQMLIESEHRSALQAFLSAWTEILHECRMRHKRIKRWAVDIDPQSI
jgi:primosomal protein N' (replication factor Y)